MNDCKGEKLINTTKGKVLLLLLFLAALVGNYFSLPFLPGIEIYFGGIAVMLTILLFNGYLGVLAALFACLPLYHQPLSVVLFLSEAIFVAIFLKKCRSNLVLTDIMFWAVCGLPFLWWLYRGNSPEMTLVMLKSVLGGLFYSIVSRSLVTYWSAIGEFGIAEPKTITFRGLLLTTFTLLVMGSTLVHSYSEIRSDKREVQKNLEGLLASATSQQQDILSFWHHQHSYAISRLARQASEIGMENRELLQAKAADTQDAIMEFMAVSILDPKGISVAYAPPRDASGTSNIGVDFSDREYFINAKNSGHIYMSNVFMGRAATPYPISVISEPIIRSGVLIGVANGGIDLKHLAQRLKVESPDHRLQVTLLDRKGMIIASSNNALKVFTKYSDSSRPVAKESPLGLVNWENQVLSKRVLLDDEMPWTLLVDVSATSDRSILVSKTVRELEILVFILVCAILVSEFISRMLSRPLAGLVHMTTVIPDSFIQHNLQEWPKTSVTEISSLVTNFIEMANQLDANFHALERAAEKNQEERNKLEATIAGIGMGVSIQDREFRVKFQNHVHEDMIGGDFSGQFCYESYEHWASVCPNCPLELAFSDGQIHVCERFVTVGGENRYFEITASPVRDAAGNIVSGIEIVKDITESKKQAELLWEAKEKAQVTLHSIGDAVIVTDARGVVDYLNPVAQQMTGWDNQEAKGRPLLEIFNIFNETTGMLAENPVEKCLREKRVVGLANHTCMVSKDGLQYSIEDSAAPIISKEGEILGVVLVFHDITEKKRLMDEMVHQAFHDSLTALPNRALFNDRLSQAIATARRSNRLVAVLFIDLDHFKLVNDMLGHAMGDVLLVEVADRLAGFIRESDTLARLGGDEFTIILSQIRNEEDAAIVAEQILGIFSQPFVMKGQPFHITASIGIAIYPMAGEDTQTLMRNADTAMYSAKELGRNTYQYYAESMNEKVQERVQMETALRRALANEEFTVFYQPMVDLQTNKVLGVEALVRWKHPQQGYVSPMDFIPLAEDIGLIIPIGEWVLKKACAQNRAWQDMGYEPIKVTVNLSARQLQKPDFVEDVVRILEETGLDHGWLEFEITESVAMQDIETTIRILHQLGSLGVQFAIDDFGTGYSSLNYLRLFPIHTLKIDRSFIRDIHLDSEDAAIVTTIIVLCQNLNLNVIAEGVETQGQVDFLRERRCYQMQGYYFGKPMPGEKVEEMLVITVRN
ncbi:MAG TPA: EAL domain-containing protein [Bacillota bacterium]|nr:EAL domain-containing protein [Bacillota bacterium]